MRDPPSRAVASVRPGDLVILATRKGDRLLLRADPGTARVPGLGIVDPGALVGRPWGSTHAFGPKEFLLLPPSTLDLVATLDRKAQIVLPKDAAAILLACDLRAGKRVLEAGAGSGALTLTLAAAVAPTGRVTTVEIRQDFLDHAKANVTRAGLGPHVDFHLADVAVDPPPGPYDAVVLDLPDPERAIPTVTPHLAGGGHLCCYTPLVSQAEAARRALDANGYALTRTVEILERELIIGERGSRPSHDMLAHTAYLTFARRAL